MSAREDGLQQLSLPDMERRLANTVRYGTVLAVDLPNKRVRVKSGDIESTWLPWPAGRAGAGKRRWDPPEVGEQVAMLAPGGDLRQAMVIPGLYQDAHDAPSADANEDLVEYSDGTVIGYNRSTHTLTANLGDSSLVMTRAAVTTTIGSTSIVANASSITLSAGGSTIVINAAGVTINGAAINLN